MQAPAIFRKCTSNGLPVYAVALTASFSLLTFMTTTNSASKVFNWLSDLSTITGLIT